MERPAQLNPDGKDGQLLHVVVVCLALNAISDGNGHCSAQVATSIPTQTGAQKSPSEEDRKAGGQRRSPLAEDSATEATSHDTTANTTQQ